MLSFASFHYPSPPVAESQQALYHYDQAIAALRSEPYRDMPQDLRADLLRRLRCERDAVLQQMTPQEPAASSPATVPTSTLPRALRPPAKD